MRGAQADLDARPERTHLAGAAPRDRRTGARRDRFDVLTDRRRSGRHGRCRCRQQHERGGERSHPDEHCQCRRSAPLALRRMALMRRPLGAQAAIAAVVALATFLLAYDNGGFSLSSRSITAIAVWWTLALGVGLRTLPRLSRPAMIVAGLLAAFAAWTLASAWWGSDAEQPLVEFDRVCLYLGLFLLAATAARRADVVRCAAGLAAGISATCVVALVSRFFPSPFSSQGLPAFLPSAEGRLSFPIGYWNGLALLVACGYPLCLGLSLRATSWLGRCAALMPVPLFAAAIYLASSRGGIAAAGAASVAVVVLSERRWAASGALLAAGLGSATAVALVSADDASGAAFASLLLIGAGTGVLFATGRHLLAGARPSPHFGRAAVAIVLLALVVGATTSHPRNRFETFKAEPAVSRSNGDAEGGSHLLSGSGSGRWQFWSAALDEWKSAPVIGRGAGSYESWWASHARFSYFVRNAHSLYLEVLGELGIIGFALLASALVYGIAVGVRCTLRSRGGERATAASLVGVVLAFYVGAGLDWVWQLAVVGGVAMVSLGLLAGPVGTDAWQEQRRRLSPSVRAVVAGAALILVVAQAVPWLSSLQLAQSAAAARHGDGRMALLHAQRSRELQPWAASPYLQLALVQERLGHLRAGRAAIEGAIARDRLDWRLWLVSARLSTKAGDLRAARHAIQRAASLNPRSPLFARMEGEGARARRVRSP